jgi:hypothetical protein
MRIKKVIGVGAMVGGIGIAAAACGPVNVHWETYPTGTSASLRTAEQHWWVNGGGDDLLYVNKDETTVLNDLQSGASESKTLTDINALARAAATAARNPYPGDPSNYVSLMNDLQTAAHDAEANDIPGAIAALENAETIQQNAGWGTDFPAVPADLTS